MNRPVHRAIPFVIALALSATPATGQEPGTEPGMREIVSSASAERSVAADLAVVTLRFAREGATPAEAGRNLALKADSLRRALAPLGIAPDSIVTGSRWHWWRDRVQVITAQRMVPRWVDRNGSQHRQDSLVVDTAYRAHESLQVRIRDLRRVGAVIDVALAQGITDISDVSFSATDTEREQQDAIREATRRARARAEAIADASGTRLGRTIRLSTTGDGRPLALSVLDGVGMRGAASGAPGGETVVVAPVLRVTATVHGRWELVEDR